MYRPTNYFKTVKFFYVYIGFLVFNGSVIVRGDTLEMTEMCNVICLFRFVTLHFRNHTEILNVRNYLFIYRYVNYINIKYRPPASSTFSKCSDENQGTYFMHVTLRAEIATIFGPNVVRQFPHAIQKYTKFANFASRIATKLCNFTHFSMPFLAVVIYLHPLA
jgi:hypothetical protein